MTGQDRGSYPPVLLLAYSNYCPDETKFCITMNSRWRRALIPREISADRRTVHAESFAVEIGRTGFRKKHLSFDWESPAWDRAFQSKRKGGSNK
jgi:hypothetical protein